MLLIAITLAAVLAGIGSVWIAAALSLGVLSRYTHHLLSLAAGALLATAMLHLLPEALESQYSAKQLFGLLLAAVLVFFLLDKAELYHHGHEHAHAEAEADADASAHAVSHAHAHSHTHSHAHSHTGGTSGGWPVLLGDAIHCFGDGVLIASAFVVDIRLGVAAALAVLAHEVPHHMGDVVVLRRSSGSVWSAAAKVSGAGAFTIIGAWAGYGFSESLKDAMPLLLVVGGASFIYVALADLIPQLQRRLSARETAAQVAWLLLGIGLVAVATQMAHAH
jgi:zinc and cadmium transporter